MDEANNLQLNLKKMEAGKFDPGNRISLVLDGITPPLKKHVVVFMVLLARSAFHQL